MSDQHTTPLWQTIMHAPTPEPAKRIHIGLGEYRHVWLDSDLRNFAHQIAAPIAKQRDDLLALSEVFDDAINAAINATAAQKDGLLKALEEVSEVFNEEWRVGSTQRRLGDMARAAIAKAEGGAS